jgi:hypothetical protein
MLLYCSIALLHCIAKMLLDSAVKNAACLMLRMMLDSAVNAAVERL